MQEAVKGLSCIKATQSHFEKLGRAWISGGGRGERQLCPRNELILTSIWSGGTDTRNASPPGMENRPAEVMEGDCIGI